MVAPTSGANVPSSSESIERCLSVGRVQRAQELGWWGRESAYKLVRDGGAHNFRVVLRKKRPDADLGFELSDESGIAVVTKVWPSSVAGTEGQLREGDVIRGVDGELRWTCEAVVQAIRAARGQVTLQAARGRTDDSARGGCASLSRERGAPRPYGTHTGRDPRWSDQPDCSAARRSAPLRAADVAASSGRGSWRADDFFIAAGEEHTVRFCAESAAVLRYSFSVKDFDIAMHVDRLGSDSGASPLLSLRASQRSGELQLGAGQHAVRWDNSFSFFRGKRLTFGLSLLPEVEWMGEQRGEQCSRLEAEVATLKQRAKEAAERVAREETALAAVRKQAAKLEKVLNKTRQEHEEHAVRLQTAKDELARLQAGGIAR